MRAPFIEVTSVVKRYGSAPHAIFALNELTLSIPRGEFVSVMGPSGSGKTTLLNLIVGLDAPDSGAVLFQGQDPLGAWRVRTRAAR